jgi:hypothetical protein
MDLNLIDVNQYHTPSKNSLKNSTHNMSLEIYIYIISNFVISIILSQIYSIYSNLSIVFEFFLKIEYIKCKDNQVYLKQTKKKMWCPYLSKKLILKISYLWLQIWGWAYCVFTFWWNFLILCNVEIDISFTIF